MPGEWPPICETVHCRGKAQPATHYWVEKRSNMKYYLCDSCGQKLAHTLKMRGWVFKQLTQKQKQSTETEAHTTVTEQ